MDMNDEITNLRYEIQQTQFEMRQWPKDSERYKRLWRKVQRLQLLLVDEVRKEVMEPVS